MSHAIVGEHWVISNNFSVFWFFCLFFTPSSQANRLFFGTVIRSRIDDTPGRIVCGKMPFFELVYFESLLFIGFLVAGFVRERASRARTRKGEVMADRGHFSSASRQRLLLLLLLAGSRAAIHHEASLPGCSSRTEGEPSKLPCTEKPSKAPRTGGVRIINEATCTHRH